MVNQARAAIESMYTGVCDIIEYGDKRDAETKITRKSEVTMIKDQPCKLSFERLSSAGQTETAAGISQGVKLFIAPEIRIKSGSKIVVKQNGAVGEYSASGEPAVYSSHQEIMLGLFKERA